MADLKKLRELAGRTGFTKVDLTESLSERWLCYATSPDTSSGEFVAEFVSKTDAEYFVAANPEAMLVVINEQADEIEKLKKTIEDMSLQIPTPSTYYTGDKNYQALNILESSGTYSWEGGPEMMEVLYVESSLVEEQFHQICKLETELMLLKGKNNGTT